MPGKPVSFVSVHEIQSLVARDEAVVEARNIFQELRSCVLEHGFRLEQVLPLVTCNTASVLKLGKKGSLAAGMDADTVILQRESLDLVEVIANGRRLMRDAAWLSMSRSLARAIASSTRAPGTLRAVVHLNRHGSQR